MTAATAEVIDLGKVCTRCGVRQPVSGFFMDKRRGSLRPTCKACARVYHKQWCDKNQPLVREQEKRKRARAMGVLAPFKRAAPLVGDAYACHKCGVTKPLSEFNRDKNCRHGHSYRCRACATDYAQKAYAARTSEQVAADLQKRKERYASDPAKYRERARTQTLKKQYGLSIEQFDALLAAQLGACAICRMSLPTRNRGLDRFQAHVDHDHETGRVRGILCSACNPALGAFRDNVLILEAAIAYLRRHGK